MTARSPHIALVGDSIFDNAAYTGSEPDVVTHLLDLLPPRSSATLCAVDGHRVHDVHDQIASVPPETDHIVVSIGGNDALDNIHLLDHPVRSTAAALEMFRSRIDAFESEYRKMLDAVLSLERETILCTIYNGDLEEPERHRARMTLMMFNDVILRAAFEHGSSVIDLRSICSDPSDYANPIEPSGSGGRKIARAICIATGAHGSPLRPARVLASLPD